MYLKQIILDGFKSYANRTVIDGFDKSFNAITGQNGSGKSNVLDAICFVLGISNLSQVRATELKDLVYKSGQARVSKCSVTLVFDNSNPDKSPHGYKDSVEITITRQYSIPGAANKYYINGKTANQTRVQELFKSVHLNVNNPQFLIMQGRITKVCNMKPPELLGLLEETSGVKNYEEQRNQGLRRMENRKDKLQEIEETLSDLRVRRDELEMENKRYNKSEQLRSKIEKLRRFKEAFEYTEYTKTIKRSEVQIKTLKEDEKTLLKEITNLKNELEAVNAKLMLPIQTTEAEANIVKKQKEVSSELSQIEAKLKFENEKISSTKKDISKKEKDLQIETKKIQSNDEISKREAEYDLAKQCYEEAKNLVDSIRTTITGAIVDGDENGDESQTLRGRLMSFERDLASYKSRLEQLASQLRMQDLRKKKAMMNVEREREKHETTLKDLKKRESYIAESLQHIRSLESQYSMDLIDNASVAKKQPRASMSDEHGNDVDDVANTSLNDSISSISSFIKPTSDSDIQFPLPYSSIMNGHRRGELQNQLFSLQSTLRNHKDQLDRLISEVNSRLNIRFTPWGSRGHGYHPDKIKGPLAKLITVNGENEPSCYALEISAGPKLTQIIVDTEDTAGDLLKYGNSPVRITVLPLNRISGPRLDSKTIQTAKSLVGEKANPAVDLVSYDNSITHAVEYAFGRSFICDDSKTAETIAYHQGIKCKAITLKGDVYDPQGTLTGGSKLSNYSILTAMIHINNLTKQVHTLSQEEQTIYRELENFSKIESTVLEYVNSVETFYAVQKNLKTTSFAVYEKELEECLSMIRALEKEQEDVTEKVRHMKNRITQVQDTIRVLEESSKKNDQAALQRKLDESVEKMKHCDEYFQKTEQALELVKATRDTSIAALQSTKQIIEQMHESLLPMKQNVENFLQQKQTITMRLEDIQQLYEAEIANKEEAKRQYQNDRKLKETLANRLENSEVNLEDMKKQLKQATNLMKSCNDNIKDLLHKSPWIRQESSTFDTNEGEFNFKNHSLKDVIQQLVALTQEYETNIRHVNKAAANQFSKMELKYKDLVKKQQQVIDDKEKIEATIRELDYRKNEMLLITWKSVNDSLDRIFSTLLPDTHACLEKHVVDGLLVGVEMRVAFGGVWKESLSELSGGQRSLLALSLILSLLLYKPAPMYILDEVDAALDLAHTQNIGTVIKKEFNKSQFIIVSLKDGMFNNANVLFRTKFQDGISSISIERSNV